MSHGLVFGKFAPFHTGHEHLLRTALSCCERLWVLVNDHPELTPHSAATRAAWIRDTFVGAPLEVIATGPPPPSGRSERAKRENFEHMRKHLPAGLRIDTVFCNEWYGEHIAADFDARWEQIDPTRTVQPISATQIRNAPWQHWAYLPRAVRPFFVQLVALVGGESTGKTTTAEALADRFGTTWVAEYARAYLLEHGGVCTPASMPQIAEEQRRLEEQARQHANRFLFCDTDALTTALWSEHYFAQVHPRVAALAAEQRYALHLLLAPDLPWVDDGLRDSPGKRPWFFDRLAAELSSRSWEHRIVRGTGQARTDLAATHVNEVFA